MKNAVFGIIFNEDRTKVLTVKSATLGIWLLPGGGIEENESAEKACKREILEESGYEVEIIRKIGSYAPVNKLTAQLELYECKIVAGEAKASAETSEISYRNSTIFRLHNSFIKDALQNKPFVIERKQTEGSYWNAIFLILCHPIVSFRYIKQRFI